jgi:hypothetical protein
MIDPKPGSGAVQSGKAIGFVPSGWKIASREPLHAIGPYEKGGAIPLLRAIADVFDTMGKATAVPERVVIMLPPEDLELATDPRSYQLLLEALLIHLKIAGAREIIVVPPFHYGSPEEHRKSIWKAVRDATEAYDCQAMDATDFAHEKYWRVDPSQEGVYGARPNAGGVKMIEQGLTSLIP